MFRVLTPIIRSSYNCNYSFWYWLTGSTSTRSRCWVGIDSCVPYGRFKVNLLSINVDKTHYIQFKTKNKPTLDINIVCNDNLITTLPKIKFLGICIHDSIKWSCHIEYIIQKLTSACYIMRSIELFRSVNTLKTIYYSYFNAIISYGVPFWGNSPQALKIFRVQKRIESGKSFM